MGQAFEQWEKRIAEAGDEEARRALAAEVALWRARRLQDVVASRRATWALSRLHALLDDRPSAVREARSLISLCQTPPVASEEELAAATAHLQQLGESVPPMPGLERRRSRGRRGGSGKKRRGGSGKARGGSPGGGRKKGSGRRRGASALDRAKAAAAAGRTDEVHELASGRSGPTWALVRVHADLTSVRALQDPGEIAAALASLHDAVGRTLSLPTQAADDPVSEGASDPLSALLGKAAPRKRGPRVRAIERFADAHPDRIDELAAAALRHHLLTFGAGQPAPWLVGMVGRALARSEAPRTAEAIAELREAGASAVLAYDEGPFQRLVPLVAAARAGGWTVTSLRRGVLSRGEPPDRKVWTLRVRRGDDGPERMLAVAPEATEPYAEGKAEELAERMQSLCPLTVILAPGAGNAGLRSAMEALGLPAHDADPGDAALLASLEAVAEAPAEPPPPSAPERLVALMEQDAPDPDAVVEVLGDFRRPTKAFRVAERADPGDRATAALLQAVPRVVDADASLGDGVTLAARVVAAGGDATRQVLTGELMPRYGGEALQTVTRIATALAADGWQLFRVLRGPTRRERKEHAVLETLADAMQGLWRILVRRDDARGEVWYIHELPAEGRAGVPQLLRDERQRAVVLPVEPELLAWYRTLEGPEPIGWTGEEVDALRGTLGAWLDSSRP